LNKNKDKEFEEFIKNFMGWFNNGGREELNESINLANKEGKEMLKKCKPDLSRIHEPMTI